MFQPMGQWNSETWAEWVTAAVGSLGIIGAILKVGYNAVQSNAKLAASLENLAEAVKSVESRLEVFTATSTSQVQTLNGWQRTVDSRLASIEAWLASLDERRKLPR